MEAYGGMPASPLKLKGDVCHALTKKKTKCKNRASCDSYYCASHEALYKLDQPTNCPICFDELPPSVRPISCGHYMHEGCLQQWLKDNYSCPLCRKLLKDKPLEIDDSLADFIVSVLRQALTTDFSGLNTPSSTHTDEAHPRELSLLSSADV